MTEPGIAKGETRNAAKEGDAAQSAKSEAGVLVAFSTEDVQSLCDHSRSARQRVPSPWQSLDAEYRFDGLDAEYQPEMGMDDLFEGVDHSLLPVGLHLVVEESVNLASNGKPGLEKGKLVTARLPLSPVHCESISDEGPVEIEPCCVFIPAEDMEQCIEMSDDLVYLKVSKSGISLCLPKNGGKKHAARTFH